MMLHYRRLIAGAVLSVLVFGAVGLPSSDDNTSDQPETGYSISESMMYGEPVVFTEDGEFLEYVSEKRQQNNVRHTRDKHKAKEGSSEFKVRQSEASTPKLQKYTCGPVSLPLCQGLVSYPLSQYPNILGHKTEKEAARSLAPYLALLNDNTCGDHLRRFLCLLLAPQCIGTEDPLAPCRSVCLSAYDGCLKSLKRVGITWPDDWSCDRFANDGLCSELDNQVSPVPEPITKSKQRHHSKKASTNRLPRGSVSNQSRPSLHKNKHGGLPASPESFSRQPIRARRYDIGQVGQSGLFQGWADVQGQGAANDYCRVIGSNRKLHFLSCTLAGSTGPNHHYVSKRGFDVGHQDTWFMRDMDGDGRDDYCRCVGRGIKSVITCMKAGEHGFYGSPQQPGDEYTFIIQSPGPCFQRKINPFLGI